MATLVLENLSGIGFDAAIIGHSTSIGGCIPTQDRASGLGLIYQEPGYSPAPQWRYVPAGGKFNVSVGGLPCDQKILSLKSADVAASLAIKMGDTSFNIPISTSAVPVRGGKP
jgi:hypothetical protein